MPVKKVTLLIGPSCVGKSTYLINQSYDYVISSDKIVNDVCKEKRISYSDFFNLSFHHSIRKYQRKLFMQSVNESKRFMDIVWDITNLTKKNRQQALNHYPKATYKALNFSFKGYEHHIVNLNNQRNNIGAKVVPEQVLKQMFDSYEPVKLEEGFSEITNIDFFMNRIFV
jgi:predicted kinase